MHPHQAVQLVAVRLNMRQNIFDRYHTFSRGGSYQWMSERRLARLKADIHLLDKRMAEIVAADAILAQRYELLTSMRGVGPTLAFTLIALLPELGQMSRKQIAALVGLAPYDFDSGKLKGHRCIYGGRMPVRNILYIAAMSEQHSCSFDHLVGELLHRRRNSQTERFRGLEVDDELKFGWLLHWDIAGLGPA